MTLFTVVFDYDGGTYVEQVRAEDCRSALRVWAHHLDLDVVDSLARKDREEFLNGFLWEDEPVPLNGLSSVWATTTTL